jgi:hypothetical protein
MTSQARTHRRANHCSASKERSKYYNPVCLQRCSCISEFKEWPLRYYTSALRHGARYTYIPALHKEIAWTAVVITALLRRKLNAYVPCAIWLIPVQLGTVVASLPSVHSAALGVGEVAGKRDTVSIGTAQVMVRIALIEAYLVVDDGAAPVP